MAKILGRLLIGAALAALIGIPMLAARDTLNAGAGCDQAIARAMGTDPSSDTVGDPTEVSASCAAIKQWLTGVEAPPVAVPTESVVSSATP